MGLDVTREMAEGPSGGAGRSGMARTHPRVAEILGAASRLDSGWSPYRLICAATINTEIAMQRLVLGGTGSVGRLVVEEALKRRQSDETARHALA